MDWAADAADDAELAIEATSFKAPWTFVDVIGATGVLVISDAVASEPAVTSPLES